MAVSTAVAGCVFGSQSKRRATSPLQPPPLGAILLFKDCTYAPSSNPTVQDDKENLMGMEMRQELKLSQQLVMTPQLQQAIKLLQLSRMELADLVHEEMLENPLMDDEMDLAAERNNDREAVGGDEQLTQQMEGAGETELPVQAQGDAVAATDVKDGAAAVNEIDWENYLDSYQAGPSMPGFRGDNED